MRLRIKNFMSVLIKVLGKVEAYFEKGVTFFLVNIGA